MKLPAKPAWLDEQYTTAVLPPQDGRQSLPAKRQNKQKQETKHRSTAHTTLPYLSVTSRQSVNLHAHTKARHGTAGLTTARAQLEPAASNLPDCVRAPPPAVSSDVPVDSAHAQETEVEGTTIIITVTSSTTDLEQVSGSAAGQASSAIGVNSPPFAESTEEVTSTTVEAMMLVDSPTSTMCCPACGNDSGRYSCWDCDPDSSRGLSLFDTANSQHDSFTSEHDYPSLTPGYEYSPTTPQDGFNPNSPKFILATLDHNSTSPRHSETPPEHTHYSTSPANVQYDHYDRDSAPLHPASPQSPWNDTPGNNLSQVEQIEVDCLFRDYTCANSEHSQDDEQPQISAEVLQYTQPGTRDVVWSQQKSLLDSEEYLNLLRRTWGESVQDQPALCHSSELDEPENKAEEGSTEASRDDKDDIISANNDPGIAPGVSVGGAGGQDHAQQQGCSMLEDEKEFDRVLKAFGYSQPSRAAFKKSGYSSLKHLHESNALQTDDEGRNALLDELVTLDADELEEDDFMHIVAAWLRNRMSTF